MNVSYKHGKHVTDIKYSQFVKSEKFQYNLSTVTATTDVRLYFFLSHGANACTGSDKMQVF